MGRTGSGKSTIVKEVCAITGKTALKSYTTRQKRNEEDNDHTFISPYDFDKFKDDIVAYVDRIGYCSFATRQQVMDCDFYIINPNAYFDLIKVMTDDDVKFIPVFISSATLDAQIQKRGDDIDSWLANYEKEEAEFELLLTKCKSLHIIYNKYNDLEYAVNCLIKLINLKEKVDVSY